MRVLIFHGYLLSGTGSNVYNARLAETLAKLGHEVHLLCQDRHPERQPFVGHAGDWDGGELRVHALEGQRRPEWASRCRVYRPDIGGLLPVYVLDRYEGIRAMTFAQCSDAQVDAYVHANVAAAAEVARRVEPDIALANHLVMGPAILARALGDRVPYAVKVHGSALEYTVKPQPQRFLPFAREGVLCAKAVLVGSRHTAESLWQTLGDDPRVQARTRLGPPGVDVERFAPREPEQTQAQLTALIERLRASRGDPGESEGDFARDERAVADALERLNDEEGELIAFVGKLIAAKGVDLLLDAWPLVLERCPRARLAVIGFGAERERFQARAAPLGERVIFTGRLDHEELAAILPGCEALVVPSTFPEAFGMVAVEAAACGVLPISAAHSGLAEVSDVLARELPIPARSWLSFPVGHNAPRAIAARIVDWLMADPALKRDVRARLVHAVRTRWSWEGVARGLIEAALSNGQIGDEPRS